MASGSKSSVTTSVWVWDHMLLGVEPNFPIIDSLTVLTGIAARTQRIRLGTGILVLPLRNPVTLAKQLSSMDQLSQGRLIMGHGVGLVQARVRRLRHPVRQARQADGRKSRDHDPALDRGEGLRQIHEPRHFRGGHVSQALSAAAHADPHRRLCRQGAAARGDGRRRLADLFLPTRRLHEVLEQDPQFRDGGRQGSGHARQRLAAADHGRPLARGRSRAR